MRTTNIGYSTHHTGGVKNPTEESVPCPGGMPRVWRQRLPGQPGYEHSRKASCDFAARGDPVNGPVADMTLLAVVVKAVDGVLINWRRISSHNRCQCSLRV